MKPAVLIALVGIGVAVSVAIGNRARLSVPVSDPTAAIEPAGSVQHGGAVVLELFTSQGCSSCPPADRLLSRLGSDPNRTGRIVPLAFHVDYWNYIGWSDPFSSKDWTDRQYAYASRLNLNGVYTPQIVVNGRVETVGSNESAVVGDIDAALKDSRVELHATATFDGSDGVGVHVDIGSMKGTGDSDLTLVVALFENGVETRVLRGENSGKVLVNDFIVRRLKSASIVRNNAGGGSGDVQFSVEPPWNRANLGVAAFVQDRATLHIDGATTATPR